MRRQFMLVIFCIVTVGTSCGRLFAQSDLCADPRAARVGVFTTSGQPQTSDSDLVKRERNVERHFAETLIKHLVGLCVVRDIQVFSEPENYPALKGSMIIHIDASPSRKDANIAAIAVDMVANQGAYVEQNFPFAFLSILIESDADYDAGARSVMDYWSQLGQALESFSEKKSWKETQTTLARNEAFTE